MGYHYYNYEVYLESDTAYTPEKIAETLSAFNTEISGSRLTLSFDDWKLWIVFSHEAHVAEEAAEIGEIYKYPKLAACNARLEISAEDDPDEDHYNDHLYVLEALSDLPGVHIFDPQEGAFPYAE